MGKKATRGRAGGPGGTYLLALDPFLGHKESFSFLFFLYFAAPHGLWDLSSLTRD